jgi:hypothetical protein
MQSNHRDETPSGVLRENLPAWLLALALVVWFSFQLILVAKARGELAQAVAAQEAQVQTGGQIKQALSALATATKRLALQGNPNAAQLVNSLAGRGIKIEDPPPGQVSQTLQN